MLCLMLDLCFEDLALVNRFLGSKSRTLELARKYDKKCFLPYFVKNHKSKNLVAGESLNEWFW